MQQVAAGEQADEHALEQVVLPDDDALDLEERGLERGGGLGAAPSPAWRVGSETDAVRPSRPRGA